MKRVLAGFLCAVALSMPFTTTVSAAGNFVHPDATRSHEDATCYEEYHECNGSGQCGCMGTNGFSGTTCNQCHHSRDAHSSGMCSSTHTCSYGAGSTKLMRSSIRAGDTFVKHIFTGEDTYRGLQKTRIYKIVTGTDPRGTSAPTTLYWLKAW